MAHGCIEDNWQIFDSGKIYREIYKILDIVSFKFINYFYSYHLPEAYCITFSTDKNVEKQHFTHSCDMWLVTIFGERRLLLKAYLLFDPPEFQTLSYR